MKGIIKLAKIVYIAIFVVILMSYILPDNWVDKRLAWWRGDNYYTDSSSRLIASIVNVQNQRVYMFRYRTDDGVVVHYQRITTKTQKIANANRVYKTITPSNQIVYCTNKVFHHCF